MSSATIDILGVSWKLEVFKCLKKNGGPMEMDRNGYPEYVMDIKTRTLNVSLEADLLPF